jgi:hypothetical protein
MIKIDIKNKNDKYLRIEKVYKIVERSFHSNCHENEIINGFATMMRNLKKATKSNASKKILVPSLFITLLHTIVDKPCNKILYNRRLTK